MEEYDVDLFQQLTETLTRLGAIDVQVTRNDANTEYERQHRITCVFENRAYELNMGLVRQHGGIIK